MGSPPSFQIIFMFTQDSSSAALAGNLTVKGDNSFVLDGSVLQQVLPYETNAIPALNYLCLSKYNFRFEGVVPASESSQSLELATAVTAIGDRLEINVANVGQALIRYQFYRYRDAGSLQIGPNSIPFPAA